MGKRPEEKQSLTGSDLLVRSLERLGVPQVWGFPGHVPDFIEELHRSHIDYISTRHGQAVAFAAEVVGRFANRPSACYASLEFDAVNLMAAVANAYMNGAPVLILLTGARSSGDRLTLERQSMVAKQILPMLKFAISVSSASEIPAAIDRAYHAALHGRPGPVVLRLPESVLHEPVTEELGAKAGRQVVLESPRTVEYQQLESVYRALATSRAPLIVAGDEIVRGRAEDAFKAFVERFEIPVFTTLDAKGVIPEDHPLCFGPLAEGFDESYDFAVTTVDLILFIGCQEMTGIPGPLLRRIESAQVVSVGSSLVGPPELTRCTHVVTNLRSFLKLLAARNPGLGGARTGLSDLWARGRAALDSRLKESGSLGDLLNAMRTHLRPEDVIVCDVSLSAPVGVYYQALRPRTVVFSAPSAMGFEIPGAIGIKSTEPGRRVVALCVGPSLLLSIQEIETSIRSDLPIIVVLLTTEAVPKGGWIASGKHTDRSPFVGDVVALAGSFGAIVMQTRTTDEFEIAFRQACLSPITTLIIAPSFEQGMTGTRLHNAVGRIGDR
jgi:acetolactate synthase-1/2/3 large subunit